MIIFGAAHANYPAQPAYARVVELLVPSAVFGFLYLRFGLLPAIVMHFAYDVVWFAMPLFVAQSPGLVIDRALVIALALIPLAVPIVYRWKQGAWKTVEERDYNVAWQPAPEEDAPIQIQPIAQPVEGPARARYAWRMARARRAAAAGTPTKKARHARRGRRLRGRGGAAAPHARAEAPAAARPGAAAEAAGREAAQAEEDG